VGDAKDMLIKDIAYSVDGKTFTGCLADKDTRGAARPGVLVCHQGGGLTEHAKERARMLAELGYVAFALDMYGEPVTSMEHAMGLLRGLMQNPAAMRARAHAALDLLKAQTNVDPNRLAAIGFCFGGAVVLEIARSRSDVAAVVAFHPGMTELPGRDARKISSKVMVCAGADDPLIPPEAREKFIRLMNECGADWQFLTYGGAGHSFTDKSVDALNMKGFAYHASTDKRSWAAMRELFDETLGKV
jgi:dienelactone hydrolase